jgi:hypothetical protein
MDFLEILPNFLMLRTLNLNNTGLGDSEIEMLVFIL